MWEIDVSGQLFAMGEALALGALYCLLFDLLKALRISFKLSSLQTFFIDVLLFVFIGFTDFFFFLSKTNGEVRVYVYLAQIIGFICFRLLASRFVLIIMLAVLRLIKLCKNLLYKAFFCRIKGFFSAILKKTDSSRAKTAFFMKKRLKKPDELVYTKGNCLRNENGKDAT